MNLSSTAALGSSLLPWQCLTFVESSWVYKPLFTSTVLSDLITERTRISQHFAVFGPQWWQNQGPLLLPAFCPCLVPSGGTHFS